MFVLLAACLIVSVAVVQPCCFPDTWEADLSLTMAYMDANNTGHYTEGFMRVSFDSATKMVTTGQSLVSDGIPVKQRLINDYNKGVTYTLGSDGSCKRTSLGPWVPTCAPANASYSTYRYGLDGSGLEAKGFFMMQGDYEIYLAVTADTCVPIAEDVIDVTGKEQLIQNLVYSGVSPGIKDNSVFNVPSYCDNSILEPALPGLGRRRSLVI